MVLKVRWLYKMAGVFKLPCSLTILFGYRGIKPTNRRSLLKLEGVIRTKENVNNQKRNKMLDEKQGWRQRLEKKKKIPEERKKEQNMESARWTQLTKF